MNVDFEKGDGLVPVIVQDALHRNVLMLGYMNEEALDRTRATKRVTFFSRTRGRLWTKGETSGNELRVQDMRLDCDRDTLLILATPTGPVCHTGSSTCFGEWPEGSFLVELERIIGERKSAGKAEESYTARLMAAGTHAVAQKIGEEATEVVIEAIDGTDERLLSETADLLFHMMVMLAKRDLTLDQVVSVLRERHQAR